MADATARRLRKTMSPPEILLWGRLKQLRVHGWHFRRQAPEASFVLDFICRRAGLVVEVDGDHHGTLQAREHDAARDAVLQKRGLHVVGISAAAVLSDVDAVTDEILKLLPAQKTNIERDEKRVVASRRYHRLIRLGLRKFSDV